jgi:type IV secretory pathway protease TraF
VREWVTVDTFALDALDPRAMSFEINVAGAPSGSASLEIDSQGRPVARRQTVRFSSGEMRVVERYSAVAIEP